MQQRPIHLVQLVTRLDTGGVPEQLLALLEGLAEKPYRITVVCREVSERYRQRLERLGVTLILLKMHRLLHPRDLLAAVELYRLLRRLECDVLHTHTSKAALLGALVGWLAKVPVRVNTAHNLGCLALPQAPLRALFWLYDKLLFTRLHAVITVSQRIRDRIVQLKVLPDAKAIAIPNGINTAPFAANPAQRQALRAQLGLADNAPAIITVARLVWFKGLDNLIAAMAPVLQQHPTASCWIVGDGPLKSALQQQAEALGIAKNLHFLGERNDIPALLNAMDVFVLPSVSEGMPITLLEAMAAGKPLVATDVGGVGEMFQSGESGLLVPPRNPQALAQALIQLLNNAPLRNQMAQAARQRLEHTFSQAAMVQATHHLYHRLLTQRGQP